MKHYTHFSLQDKSEVMQKLPQINSGATVNIKTGTDDNDTIMANDCIVGDINNSKRDELCLLEGGRDGIGYDQNLTKQANLTQNCLDRAGQENSENFESSVNVSGCDIKKNTVKDSVLNSAKSLGFNDSLLDSRQL